MALPLFAWKILAAAIAKKATVYVLGRIYGFPRMYRRYLEFSRRRAGDIAKRKRMQERIKYVFRLPNRLFSWFHRRK